jgi:hypothetical protein
MTSAFFLIHDQYFQNRVRSKSKWRLKIASCSKLCLEVVGVTSAYSAQ